MRSRDAITQQMATLLAPRARDIFIKECQIDPGYQVFFIQDWVFINAKILPAAYQLVKRKGELISRKLTEWFRTKCEIHSSGNKPLVIKPNYQMKPQYPWISGNFELTPALMRAMADMCESETPKGLVTPAGIQLWVNPAAAELFKLTSMSQAVPRDTTTDWLPQDLERKRQMIRDAGDRPFEITYRTRVGDGSWKKLVNSYQLIDGGKYLIGENLGSEILARQTILA